MSKSSIKSLLQAIRALIMKSRPAYKDYLGNETVTTTTNIVSASLASVDQNFPIPSEYVNSSFTGLVAGETYTVSVNNVSNDYTATSVNNDLIFIGSDTYANINAETPPTNYWFVTWTKSTNTLTIGQAAGTYLSKSLRLSKTMTKVVDHWDIKKLPEECLPYPVNGGYSVKQGLTEVFNGELDSGNFTDLQFLLSEGDKAYITVDGVETEYTVITETIMSAKVSTFGTCTYANVGNVDNYIIVVSGIHDDGPVGIVAAKGTYLGKTASVKVSPIVDVKIPTRYLDIDQLKSDISVVGTTANSAITDAENAYNLANNANTKANSAQTTANAALPKAGGTMTGSLVLKADPTAKMEAATKQYVDANKFTGEYKRKSDNQVVGINNFQYSSNVAQFYYRATINQGTTRCEYYLGLHNKSNLSILCFQDGHIQIGVSGGVTDAEQNIVFTNDNKTAGYGGVNISGIEGITMFSSSSSEPNRKKFRVTVDDTGKLTTTEVTE